METILERFNGKNRQKTLTYILAVSAVLVLLYMGYGFLFPQESTDDAFIEGHVIMVSPQVTGHIVKVYIQDNQLVHQGDLLAQIDPRDYVVALDLANAQMAEAQAEFKQAKEDLERYTKLFSTGDISNQQFDKVILRSDTASANLDMTKAGLEQARLNLSYTKITAISTGRIAHKSIEEGDFVQPGGALLAIVPQERWVIANFKETQLTRMKPGQKVTIHIDAFPQKEYYGHVDSIQRGTGARFSLLPAENATGNFVKVVQRVPVKILFDPSPNDDSLVLGMSVEPVVKLK